MQSFEVKNATGNFGGEIFYAASSDQLLSSHEVANKIMICETITPFLRTKSEALGIKGFVSLKSTSTDVFPYHAQIKRIEDYKKIIDLKFLYCVIDSKYSKISFYK